MNSENQPSYYAIIPANVRYDKNLCANAKLFYGEITALCNQHGYCWASNKYFSDLYGVDERTITRWLDNLKKNDYIEVHTKKIGFKPDRKIFLKDAIRAEKKIPSDSQKNSTKGQKCPTDRTKMSPREGQKCPHNITSNNTLEKQQQEASPPSVVVVVFSELEELKIPKSMKEKLSSEMDAQKAKKLVKRVKAWKGRSSDSVACNTILSQWDTWDDKVPPEDTEEDNRKWAFKNLKQFESQNNSPTLGIFRCDVMMKYVEFIPFEPSARTLCFRYESSSFKEDVTAFIKKIQNK